MAASAELAARVESRLGSLLNGKWRLDSVLGIGGMAAVYAATHRNQNRVAIKMLHPELSIDAAVRGRFLREGYVANTVGHSGAVAVFDDDVTEDGSAFLVMELLEGETLEERAKRKGGRLDLGEALLAIDQLLSVLVSAHGHGVVHRDLKPDNLFLTKKGQLKVLDFGIARVRELSSEQAGTSTGTFMGTPGFMAPEQARGRWDDVDVRSDIWAVGATLFSLLSGRTVHGAETASEQLIEAATKPAPPIASLVPELPQEVCALVDRALAFKAHERWPSALEMQARVRELLTDVEEPKSVTAPRPSAAGAILEDYAEPIAAEELAATELPDELPPDPRTPSDLDGASSRKRGGRTVAVGTLVVLGITVFVFWSYYSTPRDPRPVFEPPEPPAASAKSAPPVPDEPDEPSPSAGAGADASPPPDLPDATAPQENVTPARKPARGTRRTKPRKPATARPTTDKPASSKPANPNNPFDQRF